MALPPPLWIHSRSLCPLLYLFCVAPLPATTAPPDFNRDVRPILSDRCFFCHGPDRDHREADLRLDTPEGAAAVIVPGDPAASELIRRVLHQDPSHLMPPPSAHKELSAAEIAVLQSWVADGAPYQEPWAYVPPAHHPDPTPANTAWPISWVDRFILAQLEAAHIPPPPDADPVTLVRRLHFDLTGLPPSPQAVNGFLDHPDPRQAYADLVDSLLDSPHFGERMASYWLDLVRYADTVGYHGDQDHNISPYRDYVIRAFNENLPFDQFTIEQLAGDLLPDPSLDQRIATGYNRLLQTSHEGGVQEKEYLSIYLADRVRNFSAVWMGATVGCAECHDHKFDPYSIDDFYALGAFFADVDEASHLRGGNFNSLPTTRAPELRVLEPADRTALDALQRKLADLPPNSPATSDIEAEIAAINARARLTMVTVALAQPRTIRVLPRGDWLDESGPVVEPATPAFLPPAPRQADRSTRLDLARWLTSPADGVGGLTARVMANRFWYLFLGTGLSPSLEDFGGQGQPPSHPELLDRLALHFIGSGWDIKDLVRTIVTSRTYRQSSHVDPQLHTADPENRLFARQARYRLPAEMVRDAALFSSGLLVPTVGGTSIRPYQPEGYYQHLNFPTRTYQHDTSDAQWRRALYIHWQRQFLHPMLLAFDAPNREECTSRRPRSNTPSAALNLLNDPTFVEAARALATAALDAPNAIDSPLPHQPGSDALILDHASRRVLSRSPSTEESEILLDLLSQARQLYTADIVGAQALLSIGQSPVPEHLHPATLASWTTVARALLNLAEANTRQ